MTESNTEVRKNPHVSNKTYDAMKPVVGIYLPALSALYFVLANIWGLPAAEEVIGTIAAINTFLGAVLGISAVNHNKVVGKHNAARREDLENNAVGTFMVNHTDPNAETISVEFDENPLELGDLNEVRLRVRNDSQTKQGL